MPAHPMLALQIPEVGKLRLVQSAKPEVRPRTLLLRVAASGICGTDPHILHGLYPANLPLIPGHEYAGVVEAVGDGVEGFAAGDHVAVDPNILCGVCEFCRRGKVHLCKNMIALGVNIPGGFAEYCLVPVSQAFKIPANLPLAHAALAEPVACCLRGIDLAGITPGDRVVIFGAGPMGAIILQLALLQGASRVIVVDPKKRRRERAEALGASWTLDPSAGPSARAIRDQHPDGAEVVFDCSGNVAAVREALEVVGRGGTLMLYGVCHKEENLEINPFWVNDNEITIRGSYNNPNTMARALDLLVSGRLNAGAVVTDRVPLKEAVAAFQSTGGEDCLKIVIEP
ncbi:MAG TPA: zinc-dependent alcohol dehydrogenase family protein [Bryobacteraceae bacterium]|nr:zinc-dependent alcohol dehydrogenase family protein [Bryobacteraceae bacterium]